MRWSHAVVLAVLLTALPALPRADKVAVNFYGEALCPYCARFTTQVVSALFKSNVSDLMDFQYVPWGNARRDPSTGAISCQHGPRECQLNTLISCVIDANPGQKVWFPLVECIEASAFTEPDVDKVAEACLPPVTSNKVSECYTGDKGKELQEVAFNKTQALEPPHRWVPWVTVNDIPLYDDYQNLAAFVCAAAGNDASRPSVCFDPPSDAPSLGASARKVEPEREVAREKARRQWGSAQIRIVSRFVDHVARKDMGRKVVRN